MKSLLDFARAWRERKPVTLITAYDVLMARLVAASDVDAILVGDSVAMVVHGFPSTVHATLEMMTMHTAAVRRGAPDTFIVADMPFLSVRRGLDRALGAAGALLQAGANAVKVEGVRGHEEVIERLVESGIPVMGHLGLTPQAVHQLGGYRLQGRTAVQARKLRTDAETVAGLGVFAVVLECIPAALAKKLTKVLPVPTIGIGAGPHVGGQVLVLSDVLGLDADFKPKFARRYLAGHADVLRALNAFVADVAAARFPASEEVIA